MTFGSVPPFPAIWIQAFGSFRAPNTRERTNPISAYSLIHRPIVGEDLFKIGERLNSPGLKEDLPGNYKHPIISSAFTIFNGSAASDSSRTLPAHSSTTI
jgi:hypothetical protein